MDNRFDSLNASLQQRPQLLGNHAARLEQFGMRFDDLNRVRVLDEEASGQAADLRDNCGTFIKSLSDFADIAKGFIEIFDAVAKEVEKQKIQAIGAQNLLQTYAKQRETELSQLTALIRESQLAHERLQSEYNSLLQLESSQNDFMEQFVLQK